MRPSSRPRSRLAASTRWTFTGSAPQAPPGFSPTSATSPVSPTATTSLRDRHRPDPRLQRRAHPPPALAGRPADRPRPRHGRDRPPRNDTAGRACYRRKVAAGKTSMEAMRCLRRRLSDAVYRQLAADARRTEKRVREGTPGRLCYPARPTFPRAAALRTSHFRTRTRHATPATIRPDHPCGPASCHHTTARQRCQRGAPARAKDEVVHTDQPRRTLDSAAPPT